MCVSLAESRPQSVPGLWDLGLGIALAALNCVKWRGKVLLCHFLGPDNEES